MELIGPHQVLGPLADGPVDGGEQLRGDGGIQNVLQHMGEGLVLLGLVPGHVGHQMAHQSLGNGAVDPVHAHMVPVVGGPAQGQLGQIPGAHHQTAGLVGNVHEHLGALPGLTIFKGDVVVFHRLADVPKMTLDRLADVNALEGAAQPLGQLHGVVPGAVGGAEAGHGHGDDVAGRPVQQAHSHPGDEHSQGRV